jgi:hypothetical protein
VEVLDHGMQLGEAARLAAGFARSEASERRPVGLVVELEPRLCRMHAPD